MTPCREERIGRHEIALFADRHGLPRLTRIVWVGDVSVADARAVVDVFAPCVASASPIFITDLSRLGKMPFAAMRTLAGDELQHPGTPRHFVLGYAVANLRTRVIMSIITRAAAFTTRDTVETGFFDTLDEAMQWGRAQLAKS